MSKPVVSLRKQHGSGACFSKGNSVGDNTECLRQLFHSRLEGLRVNSERFADWYKTTVNEVLPHVAQPEISKQLCVSAVMQWANIEYDVSFLQKLARAYSSIANEGDIAEIQALFQESAQMLQRIKTECEAKELELSLPSVPKNSVVGGGRKKRVVKQHGIK